MKLKLNIDLDNFKKGDIIDLESKNGIALNGYWRRRIADAKKDGCVTVIDNTLEKKNLNKPQKKSPVGIEREDKNNNKNSEDKK